MTHQILNVGSCADCPFRGANLSLLAPPGAQRSHHCKATDQDFDDRHVQERTRPMYCPLDNDAVLVQLRGRR